MNNVTLLKISKKKGMFYQSYTMKLFKYFCLKIGLRIILLIESYLLVTSHFKIN